MGARSGGGGGNFEFPTHNGTSESMQKFFDKTYRKNLKSGMGKAFAKRMALQSTNNWFGTNFKQPLIAPVNAVLSSTNKKGNGVSISMPF